MSDNLPLVSVIITAYNRQVWVRDAIESVLNQTYKNIELILVDNGSTDSTAEVLKEYASKHSFIKVICNGTNIRPTLSAMNGLKAATGDYISWLCDDDFYLPEKIKTQVECFSRLDSSYGFVYSSGYRLNAVSGEQWLSPCFKESGWVLKKIFQRYIKDGVIVPISPLIKRECYIRYPFHPEILSEGDDIYVRFAMGYQFQYIDMPLVVMRDHQNNMGKATKTNTEMFLTTYARLLNEPEIKPDEKRLLKKYIACVMRNYSWQGIRVVRDKAWAWDCLKNSLKWDWKQIFHPRILATLVMLFMPRNAQNLIAFFRKKREVVVAKESYSSFS